VWYSLVLYSLGWFEFSVLLRGELHVGEVVESWDLDEVVMLLGGGLGGSRMGSGYSKMRGGRRGECLGTG